MGGKITTALTKKEAEIYRAQGLHKEARELYDGLLASSPNIDPEVRLAIQSKIQGIDQELVHSATRKRRQLTAAEMLYMKKGWGEKATASDMLVCAQAFIQIGSYDEALKEFKNLLHRTGVKKSYMNAIALCLVHLHNPQQLPLAAEQLSKAVSKTSRIFLAMQLALAKQIEAHQYKDHALAMYEYMRKYPELSNWPESSNWIVKRIAALSAIGENILEPDIVEPNESFQSGDNADPRPSLAGRLNPFTFFKRNKRSE